jgi:C1A family cysteine protease
MRRRASVAPGVLGRPTERVAFGYHRPAMPPSTIRPLSGGWRPDPPSDRDYRLDHESLRAFVERFGLHAPAPALPPAVDLRDGFLPVRDQGPLNACTSFAAAALFEHGMIREGRRPHAASPLFLYAVQRELLQERGDRGSYLRTSMEALALAGACPEKYWPYVPARLDVPPPSFCYAVADNFEALTYYRLDHPGLGARELLRVLKLHLARGLPVMLGCRLFPGLPAAATLGTIPEPSPGEPVALEHAFVAAGYDDEQVTCDASGRIRTGRGALRVRSSWGPGWADGGHAWLPYGYVLRGLTRDFWVLVSTAWVDLEQFAQPS